MIRTFRSALNRGGGIGTEVLEAAFGGLAEPPGRTRGRGGTATTAGPTREALARVGAHRTV